MRHHLIFEPGDRFEKLTVIEPADPTPSGGKRYRCRCDCGRETIAVASNLYRHIWKSCGCTKAQVARENGKKHIANTRFLTYRGVTRSLGEWAAQYGLTKGALRGRLDAGWDLEKALTFPMKQRHDER